MTDDIHPLSLKPVDKTQKHRRHQSVPVLNLERLGSFLEDKQNDEDDAPPTFNVSAFSKDPIQFALELKSMIESIKNKNELPTKSITVTLLNVLDFWITNHGIIAINELKQNVAKYDSIHLEHDKQKRILKRTIEEYKKEYNQVQQSKESMKNSNQEFTTKLKEAEQKLANARFLQLQIITLREELDRKSLLHDKNLQQRTLQQKQINTLTNDKMQLQDIITSQKSKFSKMNLIDTELKNKINELNEMNNKYKDIELKLDKMSLEKEELFEENKSMKHKLSHYGKLKENLNEYDKNETEYLRRIKTMDNVIQNYSASSLDDLVSDDGYASSLHDELDNLQDSASDLSFVEFNDDVHTYNIEENELEAMEPKFDENELKEFKEFEEFDIGEGDGGDKRSGGWGAYRVMYRSFVVVGVLCLCYFLYVRYYKRGAWGKANEIRDKYMKWKNSNSLGGKKGVVQTLLLRKF